MVNVGFIGLGTMGGTMVQRLLSAGHEVVGHNRTKSKADWLINLGMTWADNPRDVASLSEVVISMVSDTDALKSIVHGQYGILEGLKTGSVYIDMSTIDAATSRDIAKQVKDKGSHMLDAPVSGSSVTLSAGRLSIMVGGERVIFDRVKPLLEDIGPTVNYVGENGLALIMKISTNLNLPIQILSFAESILLAEKNGIPRDTAVEVLLNSVVASPALQYRVPLMLDMLAEVLFDVDMMQKDLNLALVMGQRSGVPLPITSITNQFLTAARAMGLARKDFACLYEVLSSLSGR
ncbi:MAG: NAD(P)-dependent oxidoreductase [Chloroflexota bacterium]|nr:NAD(P)-dependent oxidoreductase [Chloroflexota bacterium]